MFSIRTDLALEAGEIFKEQNPEKLEIEGVKSTVTKSRCSKITEVKIETQDGAKALNKPLGTYITIESECVKNNDITTFFELSESIKSELLKLLGNTEGKTILIAGLGNREITPDSIGPKVISNLLVTRHIFAESPEFSESFGSVCAIAPGVLGITGIETLEILKGITEKIKPDTVIVTDALAARKLSRLSATIQLSDAGIIPGSGVANSRKEISEKTLGIKTIAIGVPMVCDAVALVYDSLNEISVNDKTKENILNTVVQTPRYMICPKDVDALSERISKILADGINLTLHPKLSFEEISSLIS